MKNSIKLLLGMVIVFLLASCTPDITEELNLESIESIKLESEGPDGSDKPGEPE